MIRLAVPGDAEAIVALRARAWWHAYADFLDVESALGEPEGQLERWRGRLESGEPVTRVWEQDGSIAGYAAASGGMLRSLYVDPAAQGAGVGSALLAAAEAHLRALGHASAELEVFAAAEQARSFYEHKGWSPVPGSERIDPGTDAGELRYRKRL